MGIGPAGRLLVHACAPPTVRPIRLLAAGVNGLSWLIDQDRPSLLGAWMQFKTARRNWPSNRRQWLLEEPAEAQ